MNGYLVEIAAIMQVQESIGELSRERQYYVRAETQEKAEELALAFDRKTYGAERIVVFSGIEL